MRLPQYRRAWQVLPEEGKGLLVAGYALIGIMLWGSFTASPNYGCLQGACIVTPELIQSVKFSSLFLLVIFTIMTVGALTIISGVLDTVDSRENDETGKTISSPDSTC